VFTSSAGVYAEDDGGVVDEASPVQRGNPRVDRILDAEAACLAAGGSVVRLAGLYTADRGPHPFWLRSQQPVQGRADGLINMIAYEAAAAIAGWELNKAYAYLQAVKEHKRCIPFRHFAGATGRTGQAKEFGTTRGRWPVKSVEFILGLLKNAESNAEVKGLDASRLVIKHIQVNQAPKQRRRTYRAHGRINPYMSSPCHIEIILSEKPGKVEKDKSVTKSKKAAKEGAAEAKATPAKKAPIKKRKQLPLTRRTAAKLRVFKRSVTSQSKKIQKVKAARKTRKAAAAPPAEKK